MRLELSMVPRIRESQNRSDDIICLTDKKTIQFIGYLHVYSKGRYTSKSIAQCQALINKVPRHDHRFDP